MSTREQAVTHAFVGLARGLADGFDPVDLLSALTTDCVQILDVASAGLLLADEHGTLHVLAASSEQTRSLELFQLQREQGPCLDCYTSGQAVFVPDLAARSDRWPEFVMAASEIGLASVHAVPIRLRENILGAMGLFGETVGTLEGEDIEIARALAYVAGVTLIQDRAAQDAAAIRTQLQTALDSRVVLEQAKGVLAQHGKVDMDRAFAVLRSYAREHNYRLTAVAAAVASREVSPQLLFDHAAQRNRTR